MHRWFRPLAFCAAGLVTFAPLRAQAEDKIIVKSADDLPRHTYTIKGTSAEFLADQQAFETLLAAVVADIKADLEKCQIEDATVLKEFYGVLEVEGVVRGDYDYALSFVPKIRELEQKEAERLTSGLVMESMAAAHKAAGKDRDKFREVFRRELTKRIAPLPTEKIRERLAAVRNQAQMLSRELILASLKMQLDPILAANNGEVPAGVAFALVNTRYVLDHALDLLPIMGEIYGDKLAGAQAKNDKPAEDRWTPRLVELPKNAKATPVAVAVWDTGVDVDLFPNQLWTNPREEANGRDDDGNGYVDDLHGIAYDELHQRAVGPLRDLDPLVGDRATLTGYLAASMDMNAGIETPEVDALRKYIASLTDPDALKTFQEDMSLLGGFTHGTHVAGITVAGNPFARIVVMRETFPFHILPDHAPTVAEYTDWGRSAREAVEYFRKADVRVVNMSWRIPRAAVEGQLQALGVGGSTEERAALSRKIFAAFRDQLEDAIRSAPDILFVAGAGNEDNDVDFSEYVPAGLRLPNLITVGAVDASDRPTSFTSFGKNVALYANGYQIESYIPGGQKLRFSGTSMASPQVANLAAKILALRPKLKVAEVIKLIEDTADPLPGYEGRKIINPKAAIERLERVQ